jgi:hypothetical protein
VLCDTTTLLIGTYVYLLLEPDALVTLAEEQKSVVFKNQVMISILIFVFGIMLCVRARKEGEHIPVTGCRGP